jgi:hypothetical protein
MLVCVDWKVESIPREWKEWSAGEDIVGISLSLSLSLLAKLGVELRALGMLHFPLPFFYLFPFTLFIPYPFLSLFTISIFPAYSLQQKMD